MRSCQSSCPSTKLLQEPPIVGPGDLITGGKRNKLGIYAWTSSRISIDRSWRLLLFASAGQSHPAICQLRFTISELLLLTTRGQLREA